MVKGLREGWRKGGVEKNVYLNKINKKLKKIKKEPRVAVSLIFVYTDSSTRRPFFVKVFRFL